MANMLLSITLVSILMKVNFCANWTFRLWKNYDIKMINRLIHLSEGYIYFKDKPISDYPVYEMRWDIGYVLQQIALFPYDNQRKYSTSATNEKVERKRYR